MTRCYCILAAVLFGASAHAEDPQQCDAGAGGACGEAQAEALEALEAQASRVDLLQRQRLALKHGATELVSDQQGDFSPEHLFAEYYLYSNFYYYYYYDYLNQTLGENHTVGGHASMPFSGASGQQLAARRGTAVLPTDWYYDDTLANQNQTIAENYTVGGHASMPFSGASGQLLQSQQLAVKYGAAELVSDEQGISGAQHEHGEYYYWYGCYYYCLYYYFDDLQNQTIGENYTVGGHASMPFSGASGQWLAVKHEAAELVSDHQGISSASHEHGENYSYYYYSCYCAYYYFDDLNQTIGENYTVGGHASMPFSGASGQRLAARRGAAVLPTDWYYDETLANQNQTIGENYTVGGHASMPFSGASR